MRARFFYSIPILRSVSAPSSGNGTKGAGAGSCAPMIYDFFKTGDAVPAPEFTAAVAEFPGDSVAHALVEAYAAEGQVFVLGVGVCRVGVEVVRGGEERFVEPPPDSEAVLASPDVYRGLGGERVGGAARERAAVGVAEQRAAAFRREVRIARKRRRYPRAELF